MPRPCVGFQRRAGVVAQNTDDGRCFEHLPPGLALCRDLSPEAPRLGTALLAYWVSDVQIRGPDTAASGNFHFPDSDSSLCFLRGGASLQGAVYWPAAESTGRVFFVAKFCKH